MGAYSNFQGKRLFSVYGIDIGIDMGAYSRGGAYLPKSVLGVGA